MVRFHVPGHSPAPFPLQLWVLPSCCHSNWIPRDMAILGSCWCPVFLRLLCFFQGQMVQPRLGLLKQEKRVFYSEMALWGFNYLRPRIG